MPFGWVGCDAKDQTVLIEKLANARLQCLSAGLAVMPAAEGAGYEVLVIVSNAFRLGWL